MEKIRLDGKKGSITITLRQANERDINTILDLQKEVHDNMDDSSMLELTTREQFIDCVVNDYCILIFEGDTAVACALMIKNRKTQWNMGSKAGIDLDKSATFDTIFILPRYRGFGLQRLLIDMIDKKAKEYGAEKLVCTVSPKNNYCINNVEKKGYKIEKRCICYGDKDRYIFVKELH